MMNEVFFLILGLGFWLTYIITSETKKRLSTDLGIHVLGVFNNLSSELERELKNSEGRVFVQFGNVRAHVNKIKDVQLKDNDVIVKLTREEKTK